MALERRLEVALPDHGGDLRVSAATQSFVPFHSFCFCADRHFRVSVFRVSGSNFTNTAYAGGR